ncbi:unnamed protein product [Brachionus calyciflorus]|uniref:Uncharacterized protein n=1 Tax=Brachionus calyciflorus TaxID=104777 RepID=A0A813UFV2_9BILA|nr:unnamed protein product [Brachionus calyciflorus]
MKHQKDSAYKQYIRTNSTHDKEIFENFNRLFKNYNEEKLIDFFKDKSMNYFKNSKKFWQYYSSKISVKSDKTNSNPINHVRFNGKTSEDNIDLCNIFNVFFTSITSNSECSTIEASNFVEEQLKYNKSMEKDFKFCFTTSDEIDKLLTTVPSQSAPDISGIPTKIFKSGPNEWKTAVVTPLFKKKGSCEDKNNLRGISILPPVAK